MVGKNNHIGTIKANLDQRYKAYKAGRTWVYASIASLAMGVGLLLGSTTSYADTAANVNSTQEPAKSESDASSTATAASQKATVVPLKATQNDDTAASKADADTESNVQSGAATGSDKTAAKPASNSGTAATGDAQPANNTQISTATTTTESSASDKQTAADEQANQVANDSTSQAATQASQSKVLVDPTAEQLDAAKQSAAQAYADTHEPQEIKAVADDSTDAAPLTISANAVGYGTNEQGALTLTLTAHAKAGYVYVINIPASTSVYGFNPNSVQTLGSNDGTTVVDKNEDGSYTVTDTFTSDLNFTQTIPLSLNNNYLGQPTSGMADIGKTVTKTITYSINGVAQTPITFTQTIQPTTNLTPVTMVIPDPKTVTNLIPGKDYVFSIGVNEADGVLDDSLTSARVNSADNYGGTQITIPVPADFTLDAEGTSEMNVFDDQTTITQPGGKGTDVVINVPKGSGSQGYQDIPAYKFVGSFDIAQTAVNQTYTADGDVTFSQVINSDGDTLTDTAAPWSVVILANNGGTDIGKVAAVTSAMGNSSVTDDKLVLDNDASDDPAFLNSFGFTYDSPDDTNNAQIQLTIPDGLNVTSIQTPVSAVSPTTYLPGTTSYQYTLTLADGTTQTGTVKAGEQAKVTGNSPIRTAVFVPDKLVPGATDLNSLGSASNFNLLGSLADNYDSGAAVKNGDQLTSTIQFSFVLNGTTYADDSSVTQTVVESEGRMPGWGYESNAAPGAKGAGDLMNVYNFPDAGETTDKIFEPIFYYVIPKSSTVGSTTQMPDAKVSEFVADDGSTVVKFDYTGTGISIDTITQDELGAYATVHLDNKPDALPGDYPYYMYIVSPTTRLMNSTPAVDPSYVENNPDAVLMYDVGNGKWSIDTVSALGNSSLALGNQGVEAATTGTSDDQGDTTMRFFDTITYTSKEEKPEDDNAGVIINLPTVGDAKGSTYTFKLTGPITVPGNYTVTEGTGTPINSVVLYSTTAQTAADGTTPDTTGYVTADQVKDWSTIRSIAIEINGIKANTSTGRIEITGTTDNFNTQAGHTGYLQTIFYGNGSEANVSSTDASIAITGTSTIKTRLHYVDAAGKDQYVDLNDLSKTLNDNADIFTNDDYPTQLSDFSTNDQGLIPAGYKLVTDASGEAMLTLIDGKDASGKANGTAEFGQVVQYFYDGDIVQYELTSNVSAKIEYVDDDNNGAIVGDPTPVPGVPGGTTDWNTDKLPAGYKLADGQAASGTYEFTGDADQTVKIHLNHVIENTTATTTRTITYVVAGPNYTGKVPVAQTQTITWKVISDQAAKTSFATPTGVYGKEETPTIDGYKADKDSVDQETYDVVTNSELPGNEEVTVTYTPLQQTVTLEYVDDAKGGEVVGTPTTITGTTSGTVNWNTDDLPTGYKLAAGQPASGTYQFTNDKNQMIQIHLSHVIDSSTVTTTRTITYVVNDSNYTGKVPASQTQTMTWQIITDKTTGNQVMVPQVDYSERTTPAISGYTADKTSVPQQVYGAVTTLPQNEKVTVTYTPNAQDVTFEYVDDDNSGKVVGKPTTVALNTSSKFNWNTDDKPTGYSLAAGQVANGTYQVTANSSQLVQVHLNHVIDRTTTTTTRTIHYVVNDPNYTGQVPAPWAQTVTWNVVTDRATGTSVATPAGSYYEVAVPTLSGYIASPSKVGQQAFGSVSASDVPMYNEDVVVTYAPIKQTSSDGGEGIPDNEPGDNPAGGNTGTVTTGTSDSGTAVTTHTGTITTEVTTEKGEGSPLETSASEGTAETPARISETGKATTTPVSGRYASGSVSESRSNASATNQQKLPQTNEQDHSEVGLGVLGLLTSMLGLAGLKRRKRDGE